VLWLNRRLRSYQLPFIPGRTPRSL
jgi:hypothetical protein